MMFARNKGWKSFIDLITGFHLFSVYALSNSNSNDHFIYAEYGANN